MAESEGFTIDSEGGNLVSESGIWYTSSDVKKGTLWAIKDEDGNIEYMDGNGVIIADPYFNGDYIEWESAAVEIDNTQQSPDILCYHMIKALSEPIGTPYNTANKGYLVKNVWVQAQHENEGNSGSSDSDFHSRVKFDPYGIPVGDGDVVTTNSQTFSLNETSAYGEINSAEGLIYSPVNYGGNPVVSFELLNDEADTDRADYDQLYISMAGAFNTYTLDHQDLTLVIDKPAAGSDAAFLFDPAQRGRWARFYMFHSDMGGDSEYNWLVRLKTQASDGSITTVIRPLAEFIHKPDVALVGHADIVTVAVSNNTVDNTWDEGGNAIDAPNTSLLQSVPCGTLPVSGVSYVLGNTLTITSPLGGDGGPYTYSADGGKTSQTSPVFNFPDSRNFEVLPVIIDASGVKSGVINPTTFTHCVTYSNSAEITDVPVGRNEGTDPTSDRYISGIYSDIVIEHLEESDTPVSWTVDKASNDTSYLYLGNGFTSGGTGTGAITEVLPTTISGQKYAFKYNLYHYSKGLIGGTQKIKVSVKDMTTGNILASDLIEAGSLQNLTLNDNALNFIGSGNPVELVMESWGDTDMLGANTYHGQVDHYAIKNDTLITNNPSSDWNTRLWHKNTAKRADSPSVNFNIGSTTNYLMIGLMPKGTLNNASHIGVQSAGAAGGYTVYFPNGTGVSLYNMSWIGAAATNNIGDNFELSMTPAGTVTLYKNGVAVAQGNQDATETEYELQFSAYLAGRRIDNLVWSGSDAFEVDGWWGDRQFNNNDQGFITSNYTSNSWNLPICSPKSDTAANAVSFKFKWYQGVASTTTDGMAGLASGLLGSKSYSGIDFAIYNSAPASSSSNIRIYEFGSSIATYSFPATQLNPNDIYEVKITESGTDMIVEYKRNNVTFHTTTKVIPANTNFYARVNPYRQNNGVQAIKIPNQDPILSSDLYPDSTSYYDRFDAVTLYEGYISTSTIYSKGFGTYLLTRNITDEEVWTWTAHDVSDEEQLVIPRTRILPYGTLQPDDNIKFQYKVGGGAWVTMFDADGTINAANKLDLDVYEYRKGVIVPANTQIEYRIVINLDQGDATNRGYYIYEIADEAQCK